MAGAGAGKMVDLRVIFPSACARASCNPPIKSSKLNAISVGPFDLLDDGRDGFLLIGREVRLLFFGVDREKVEDGMSFAVKVNHTRSTAFASTRKSHAHFSDAACSLVKGLKVVTRVNCVELTDKVQDVPESRRLAENPEKKTARVVGRAPLSKAHVFSLSPLPLVRRRFCRLREPL